MILILRAPAIVLSKEKSLEKVYFDFLSIFFFKFKKKYQPIAGRHMSWGPANRAMIH